MNTTTDRTDKLAEALEIGIKTLAECVAEVAGNAIPAPALIKASKPDSPLGKMRDALAAHKAAALHREGEHQAELVGKWEGAEYWMPLAWALCADECGEEACTELVWEGGTVPEPWGDRWLKYEDEAKRLIALVRANTSALQASSVVPAEPALDEDEKRMVAFVKGHAGGYFLPGWDGHRLAALIERLAARRDSEERKPLSDPKYLLPHPYLFAKVSMVMPLFQEARDALTAISEAQRKLHGISPTLAARMDAAGTYSLDDWQADNIGPKE